jgi:dihydrofolate reductase
MPIAKKLYLTKVHKSFEGDVTFPAIDYTEWDEVYSEKVKPTETDGLEYTFINLIRKRG